MKFINSFWVYNFIEPALENQNTSSINSNTQKSRISRIDGSHLGTISTTLGTIIIMLTVILAPFQFAAGLLSYALLSLVEFSASSFSSLSPSFPLYDFSLSQFV